MHYEITFVYNEFYYNAVNNENFYNVLYQKINRDLTGVNVDDIYIYFDATTNQYIIIHADDKTEFEYNITKGYSPHQSRSMAGHFPNGILIPKIEYTKTQYGGNIAARFDLFTTDITIKNIVTANDKPVDMFDNMNKYIDALDMAKKKCSVDESICNVLSFPSMILTESAKRIINKYLDSLEQSKQINELKKAINRPYFKNSFESIAVYEFIYVLKFVKFRKHYNILFIADSAHFASGFMEYVNDIFENTYNPENVLLVSPHKINAGKIPFRQTDKFTDGLGDKYDVVTLDAISVVDSLKYYCVNYAYSFIFVIMYAGLLSLKPNGTLIMHVPFIGKKYIFDVVCEISKMFKKQASFKEDDFMSVTSFDHIVVFKGYKYDAKVMDTLKAVNNLNRELDSTLGKNFSIDAKNIKIESIIDEKIYSNYKKIVDTALNKNIAKIANSMQAITDVVKMIKMNLDYSVSVIKNKFSDVDVMQPFVWEKTETYMLDIFASIEKEEVKGHMYIIEYKNSDMVADEYINIVKKQLRFINEHTYQYVSKSNYKKYKQAELFFNSEYKILNKQLAIDYDITINGQYVSRAWMKMYEMIVQCNFVESFGQKVTGFHICEAPGNFINAMIYHMKSKDKTYDWHAQSLNPDLPVNKDAFIDEYGFIKKTKARWDFGPDNTGNILHPENFKYYIDKYKGVDVLIGDCGEQWTSEKKKKWPDQKDSPVKVKVKDLGTSQILYALNIPRVGGNCIIKTYSGNLNPIFLTLLELMTLSYSKIIFFKSNLNFWSAEVYVVGINFLGPSDDIKRMTNNFIDGNLALMPHISRYTFSQYVNLSEKILHQVFMYKTFFVYCSLFPEELEKNKDEFQKIIKGKLDSWMSIHLGTLK